MRRVQEGVQVTTPAYVATAPLAALSAIFRSDAADEAPLPLLDERVRSLQAAAQTLVDRWDGSFVNVVRAAHGSAQALLKLVLEHFPTFRDVHLYDGRPSIRNQPLIPARARVPLTWGAARTRGGAAVHILKRAQILVADLWACFDGAGLGAFHDIDSITMFADYR